MSSYTGFTPDHINGAVQDRFFYGLRRTDDGELFIGKADQLKTTDSITINNPGDPTQNYPSFEQGHEFSEGRNVNHDLVYENLNYEQFRWDDRNIQYYVNAEGELVARVNQNYTYDDNSSSNGL
mgnify:FL=1|jgi:hypothetical protein|tara:strand:- start:533 stop:904 length:372 start_codon:yes stop_codon:yes gene_type:complete